ncbi:hypothetical protein EV368DRAFT_68956 [Lentinula lateritia]|nr:hypothetical protein EV368DRAFT_68956 [Lentinula lateritia]
MADDDIEWTDVFNFVLSVLNSRPNLTKLEINVSITPLEWVPLTKFYAFKSLCPSITELVVDCRIWKYRLGGDGRASDIAVNLSAVGNIETDTLSPSPFVPLPLQRSVYNVVLNHVQALREGYPASQLLLLVHGSAGSGKSTMVALFDFISINHSPTLAFKGAPTNHGAALIGGVPMTCIPHSSTMDCGQEYFFIDVANALDVGVLSGLSSQLNNIHNTPLSIFGRKNMILFADFFQSPPPQNRFNAIWCLDESVDFLTRPFLSNVLWLNSEPLALLPDSDFLDRIRLDALHTDDFFHLNKHNVNPSTFVGNHAHEKFAIITPSSYRCKLFNYVLPIHAATKLGTTLYILNVSDTVPFSIRATLSSADLTSLKADIANCGEIPGRMAVYIGMPCSLIIDSTPVWGFIFDIQLDSREDVLLPRPTTLELSFPPTCITIKVPNKVLLHNPDLLPTLHLQPVRRRYDWFVDDNQGVMGYVVRQQILIKPRLAMLEEECEGQIFEHLLLNTEDGMESVRSFYMVASRVWDPNSLAFTKKIDKLAHVDWLHSLRQTILQLQYL